MVKFLKTDIKIKPLEVVLFVLFIFYLVFQIKTPKFLSPWLNNPIGVVVVLLFALYVFLYTNPVLGILSIFVAYELIRRSGEIYNKELPNDLISPSSTYLTDFSRSLNKEDTNNTNVVSHGSTQMVGSSLDTPVSTLVPTSSINLEEEVIRQMAPIGGSSSLEYVVTQFKPISENTHNADQF